MPLAFGVGFQSVGPEANGSGGDSPSRRAAHGVAASQLRSPFQGFSSLGELVTQGGVAALLALGCIRLPRCGKQASGGHSPPYILDSAIAFGEAEPNRPLAERVG